MRPQVTSVDDYIDLRPLFMREKLEFVRDTIRKAVPKAEEIISYRVPAYKLPSGIVLWFAGWKQGYFMCPVSDRCVAALKDQLAPYRISKRTIRFSYSQPVPVKLIAAIAKFRVRELAKARKK